ncbi:MAG: SapC family protein [Desulfovibrionaceae bacterium]|nr:SapC family protein [Desulfovibrionaceae bacterium]
MENSKIVPLSKVNHRSLTFAALDNYFFTASSNSVPLLSFEVAQASLNFPIFFPDQHSNSPHALLGLGQKNIFVGEDGSWRVSYIPLVLANYPFSIIKATFKQESEADEKRPPEFALAIDENAPHFKQDGGRPLFGEDGEPTELLKGIRNSLMSQYTHHQSFSRAFAELSLHDSFSAEPIEVRYGGKLKNVAGLRCVNRKKVLQLPDSTLGHWVKIGLMEMIYAHWNSFFNLPKLLEDPSCPATKQSPK